MITVKLLVAIRYWQDGQYHVRLVPCNSTFDRDDIMFEGNGYGVASIASVAIEWPDNATFPIKDSK